MAKLFKIPEQVRRNVPWIDRMLLAVKAAVTAIVCIVMTFICTWLSYVVQNPETEIYTIISYDEKGAITKDCLMGFLEKSKTFMTSYVICSIILWGTIGFVLATLVAKAIKYFMNYK